MPYEVMMNQQTVKIDNAWATKDSIFSSCYSCFNDVNIYINRTILTATKMLLPNFKILISDIPRSLSNEHSNKLRADVVQS
jgi:hypothetical protein